MRDDSYLWSIEELKTNAKDLTLIFVLIWNLLASKRDWRIPPTAWELKEVSTFKYKMSFLIHLLPF